MLFRSVIVEHRVNPLGLAFGQREREDQREKRPPEHVALTVNAVDTRGQVCQAVPVGTSRRVGEEPEGPQR